MDSLRRQIAQSKQVAAGWVVLAEEAEAERKEAVADAEMDLDADAALQAVLQSAHLTDGPIRRARLYFLALFSIDWVRASLCLSRPKSLYIMQERQDML